MGSESTTIAPTGGTQYNYTDVDLDERFYDLDDDEMQFLMQQTGIKDPDELKRYVIAIQREVYIIHPYPCIRLFHFVKLKARRYSVYNDVLQIAGTHPGALFLDIGCGVGNDTRRLVADGWPAHQVIASDLRAGDRAAHPPAATVTLTASLQTSGTSAIRSSSPRRRAFP